MSLRRRALFLTGLFVAVSCSDAGNPLEPGQPTPKPGPDEVLQTLQCTVNVPSQTMRCGLPEPDAGGALAASGRLITGGLDGMYVNLDASNFATSPGGLEMDVTVQNLMRQALGTEDGTTKHVQGVRVWFWMTPVGQPTGTVTVDSMSGTEFLGNDGPQPFFQYDTILRNNETSLPKRWRFNYAGGVSNIHFRVYVVAHVQFKDGWVEISPATVDTMATNETVDLNATVFAPRADVDVIGQSVTWSSSDTDVAEVDATGLVTAKDAGTVWIKATSDLPVPTPAADSVQIVVNNGPTFTVDTVPAISNVVVPEPAAQGLLFGATDPDGHTLSIIPDTVTTSQGGTAWINADGSFEYLSAPGFTGSDNIPFEFFDGGSRYPGHAVAVVTESNLWFVKPGGEGLKDGRMRHAFDNLGAAQAVSVAGDSIIILPQDGTDTIPGSITLKADQAILGAGIPTAVNRTVNGQTISILAGGGSAPGLVRSDAGAAITLATDNVIRGVAITATAGAGIASPVAGFGTLTVSHSSLSATGGAALDLNDGALAADFTTLTSTTSTGMGLSLQNVTGTLTAMGAISGSTSTAVEVSGGSVAVTYGGNVSKGGSGALLSVSGSHTGSVTFNGAVSATAGSGLLFNDADGSYAFNGTTTLTGGSGVDIGNGSDGTFSFADADITNATSNGFAVNGSTPTVLYNGDITQTANNVPLVAITEQPASADSVVFQSGTLSATTGSGILLSNADGIVRFKGTTTLDGADVGVDVIAGSDGTISFTAAGIDNDTGTGLNVFESAPTLTVAGTINTAAGSPVVVDAASPCGTVTVSANVTSSGQGIRVQDCNAGTVSFTGTKTLSTGANAGLTVSNNTGTAAVSLTGGALGITTSTGTGILGNGAGGFGSLTVANASINATNGPALNLTTGTLNGTFTSLTSTNSATTGVTLTTVSGTLNVNAGSISGATGTAFNVSGGNVAGTIAASITQGNNASTLVVAGGHNTGTLTFSGAVNATNGNGLQFTDADGTYTFTGNFSLAGAGDEGIDLGASSTGTVNVTPSGGNTANITSPSGIAIAIAGGSLNYSGNVTQASNAALLSVAGGAGGHTGTVTFPSGTLNASNGNGLQFDNADGTYDFDGTVTLAGGDAGIDVTNGSDGTFTFPQTATITSPSTGNLISILNSVSPFSFTYSGGLTKANNNVTGILISNNTGGTITFNGDATAADGDPADVARTIQSGTAAAVSLVSNGGTTINFNGGGLNIITSSGAGFNATGGGTVNVTGAGNQVNANGGGTAVNVQNTTIGGSGMSFVRVDATGSGTNGIVLQNTGAGGFQVTGDGASDLANTTRGRTTARSGGGSIVLGSGGTISGRSGDGINLNNTGAVTLRNLVISGGSADGIDATTVPGLVLDNLDVTGHTNNRGVIATSVSGFKVFHSNISGNATTASAGASAFANLQMENATGVDSLLSSTVHTAYAHAFKASNSSGTLDLRVENTQITGATNGMAAGIYPSGSSNVTANFQNDSIGHSSSRGLQSATSTGSAATYTLTVNNTAFRNNFGAIDNVHGSSGPFTFNITNNRLQTNVASSGQAINVNRLASGSFSNFGLFSGTISGNVIGTAGVANSGSDVGDGINVESNGSGGITRVAILNNTIREVGQRGIYVAAVDTDLGGGPAPTLEARVQSNNIANMEAVALDGIQSVLGALSTDNPIICLNISSNTVNSAPRNGIRVRTSGLPSSTPTLRLHGWDGVTAPATYFANLNPAATGASGNTNYNLGGGTVSSASCTTP